MKIPFNYKMYFFNPYHILSLLNKRFGLAIFDNQSVL